MGSGSELVQAFVGPHNDFGATYLSFGAVSSSLAED
jgi:hypothetical protein